MARLLLALLLFVLVPMFSGLAAGPVNFHLFDQEGRMVSLEEQGGRPVVLFFWASWSHPGERDLVALQSARKEDVAVMAVDEAVGESHPDDVRSRVRALHLDLPVLFDEIGEAADVLHVTDLPALIVLDPYQKVVWRRDGHVRIGDFARAVERAREGDPHPSRQGGGGRAGKIRDITESGGRLGTPRRGASVPWPLAL